MDIPMGTEECREQEVLTAPRQEEAKNCSTFRLKEAKVVLRDIQEPRLFQPKEHFHSLCESCRPRRKDSQGAAGFGGKCKRSRRRKSCEELLKSWKAPTRKHRLPRHLHDFVVDSTILHLIEFSDWYNTGRMARHFEPAKDLIWTSKGAPTKERRPMVHVGTVKRKRTATREHKLNRLKIERYGKRIQPSSSSSCFVLKARKQKSRCADEAQTDLLEPKHRGRPKMCTSSPHTVTDVTHELGGRRKKPKDAHQQSLASSSTLTNPKNSNRVKNLNDASQIMTASSSKPKHRGRAKKCKDAPQTMPVSATLVKPKSRGRPKKCTNALQTVPASTSTLVKPKPRGRPTKCKDALQTMPVSSSTLVKPKSRGRPKKCKDAPHTMPVSATLVKPKSRGRPKKCTNALQTVPASTSTLVKPKPRGRPTKCKDALQTTPVSSSTLVKPKSRGRPKKYKDAPQTMSVSSSTLVKPKSRGRPKKCKDAPQTMSVSESTLAKPKPRGRPKKCKDGTQTTCVPSSPSALAESNHLGQPRKCKVAPKMAPVSVRSEAEGKNCGRPTKGRNAPKANSASSTTSTASKRHIRPQKCDFVKIAQKVGESTTQSSSQPEINSMRSENMKHPTKNFGRPRKRKRSLLTSKQNHFKSVENEQACTPRLLPSINPDFSIDDDNSCMNIDEYLAQLGTYLECTDLCGSNIVGNVEEPQEGLCDENSNWIMDSEIMQKSEVEAVQNDNEVNDVRSKTGIRIDSGDEFHDENNNVATNTDILPRRDTGTRRSESGISDVSFDKVQPPKQVSKSKRSRRVQKEREQTSSNNLNLRRSERLRAKENYQRCKELWTDEGNRSRAGRSSRGNISGRGSGYRDLRTSIDDDLLQEFVAMCPLDGDIPFSDEDCLSFLAESPIFSSNGMSPSCFAVLDDKGMGNQSVNAIYPRTPPRVRRSCREFLLDEYSVHLLATHPIRSPPRHGQESGQDMVQECGGVSPGALQMYPGFGPLADSQVTLLRQLGLDATEEEPAYDQGNLDNVGRSDAIPVVSQPRAQSSQESNVSDQDSDGSDLQIMKHKKKDHRVGVQDRLKLPNHRGPVVVIPNLHSGRQEAIFAAAEVWLPSCVVESSTSNIFFMPIGEWSAKERSWFVPKVLWRNGVDDGWQVHEAQEDLMIGTCFVPEEAWLVSQGGWDKKHSRVYDVQLLPEGPGAHRCLDPLVHAKASCDSSGYETQWKAVRRNLKKRQHPCVPIPGIPPPLGVQSCLQPSMVLHPTDPYPQILTSPDGVGHIPNMIFSSGVQTPIPRLIPVFDQQLEPRLLETLAGAALALHQPHPGQEAQGVFRQHQSNIENSCCMTNEVTDGLFIGLDGCMAVMHDHNYYTPSEVMGDESLDMITNINKIRNNQVGETAEMQRDQTNVMMDMNNNVIDLCPARKVDTCEHHSDVEVLFSKTPSSVSEALDQIEACADMAVLGRMLLEWCKSDLSFRRHNQVLTGIAKRWERGSGSQSSQNFCDFAASFHAASQKDGYIPEYEDECVLVHLGLSAVSQCLAQKRPQQAQNQPVQVQDLPVPVQDEPQQVQNNPMLVQDPPAQYQRMQFQNQPMHALDLSELAQTQPQQAHNQPVQVQDQLLHFQPHQGQNCLMQVQDQPREDAYCILQMLLHLKLPLTEVLASLSLTSSHDVSLGLSDNVDCSPITDVLGVLADFDPAMAFNVIQGLGWGHAIMEVTTEKGEFGQLLIALAEALLDCKKFWQCRVLLAHLIANEGCRQPCRHLYCSLLGKLLDTEMDESAMMVFEDMMESYLIIPAPILSKLLTLMWKRSDDAGVEDALCVFHYGLGLGIYPMYRKVDEKAWEASVFVGATNAEIFFSLKTLLDEMHHQRARQLEVGVNQRGRKEPGIVSVQDMDRKLPRGKSVRYVGNGRCGTRKQSLCEGVPKVFRKKGRTVGLAGQEVQKDHPRNMTRSRGLRVTIKLMEPQQVHQGSIHTEEGMPSDEFSRMLSTKHAIQGVLENHFHPLTIKPYVDGWNSRTRKNSYTLAINEVALQSWLVAKARRETTYVVVD